MTTTASARTMTVDIWTDINCPFCYLGKARFERALEAFAHRDDVRVVHRSFELDPTVAPDTSHSVAEHIAAKYGMSAEQVQANERNIAEQAEAVGLTYLTEGRDGGSSFDMHRLLHHARTLGRQDELLDALYAANFADPRPLFGDTERLVAVATEAGLDADDVRTVLQDPAAYADDVRADEKQAATIGVSGVPFFVFAGKYAVSGAQPVELFGQALDQAWAEGIVPITGAEDAACGPDGCELPS